MLARFLVFSVIYSMTIHTTEIFSYYAFSAGWAKNALLQVLYNGKI
jgi:hypothetical protein